MPRKKKPHPLTPQASLAQMPEIKMKQALKKLSAPQIPDFGRLLKPFQLALDPFESVRRLFGPFGQLAKLFRDAFAGFERPAVIPPKYLRSNYLIYPNTRRRPFELFHYTTADKFQAICESKEFWFGNSLFLNDSQEFTYAMGLFKDALSKLSALHLDEHPIENETEPEKVRGSENFFEQLWKTVITLRDSYIFALTTKSDSLSQWRGYSGNYGYALGVHGINLAKFLKGREVPVWFGKCVYDKRAQKKLILAVVGEIKSLKPDDNAGIKEKYRFLWNAAYKIQLTAAFLKHPGFKEEEEYRLVCLAPNVADLKVVTKRTVTAPYWSLTIGDGSENDLISRIIIGPGQNSELNEFTVKLLLVNEGFGDAKILHSKIPFRPEF